MKVINKESMSFMEGFYGPKKPLNEDGSRQLDWDKIQFYVEENKENIKSVSAGLAEDWDCTSGEVWNREEGYISQGDTYRVWCKLLGNTCYMC